MAKGPECSLSVLAGGCQAGEGCGNHPVPAACPRGAVGMPKGPGPLSAWLIQENVGR